MRPSTASQVIDGHMPRRPRRSGRALLALTSIAWVVGCAAVVPTLRLNVANSSTEEIEIGMRGEARTARLGPCERTSLEFVAGDAWVLEVDGQPVYDAVHGGGQVTTILGLEVDSGGGVDVLTESAAANPELAC